MNAALQRCGFNAPTVTWLIAQGFATPNDLMLATESDLDSIARSVARSAPRGAGNVTMPFIAVKNLKGFRFWADERKRTGFEANPESFTADKVPEFTAKCQEYQEQKEAAKDEDASKPDSLKKLVNWALWNESFQNYLRQILSAAKIPLVYLTRDEREAPENVLDPADFGSPMEYLIEATVLEGRHYELITSILSGIEDICRKRRRVVIHQEIREVAGRSEGVLGIEDAVGSRRQYKFQDFINVHQTAHNEILDCDPTEAVPESKKVADFLKGITDPKLESAVSVVLGDPKLLNNFQACQQYLSTTVENRATLERSKERNISGVKSGAKDQLKEWGDKKGKRSVAALKKQIKEELKNEMKKLAKGNDNDGDDDHESSADEAAGKEFGRGAHKKKQKLDKA
ncbi:hypothetical protein MHU86_8044 [Fragilaria crotonensis]|nr:hypothetical protein MHU86_8044 [Fragilaria crotonensis]